MIEKFSFRTLEALKPWDTDKVNKEKKNQNRNMTLRCLHVDAIWI